MTARRILAGILLVLLIVFFVMNRSDAQVWFFGIRAVMPIGLVVLFSAAAGAGSVFALTYVKRRSKKS